MDVSCSKFLFMFFFIFSNAACSQKGATTSERVFPKDNGSSEECKSTQIKNQFIVHWKNGRLTYEKGENREQFIADFVDANLENIDLVEYDQEIEISPGHPISMQSLEVGTINWGPESAMAPEVWAQNQYGQSVLVAVTDTGVDFHHAALANNIAINEGEIYGNGIDDDKNGFVDDYYGYNSYDNNGDAMDGNNPGHGTHVAGIIAAEHLDTEKSEMYVQGMAPQAKILPVRFLGSDGKGSASSAIRGIDYAIKRGAKIINASWSADICVLALNDKMDELASRGILFVAAAGNSGRNLDYYPEFPAAYSTSTSITVGSISPSGNRSGFSNYSFNLVHLFAPGDDIESTAPGNYTMLLSGTSMAAPFVSGAAALLWGFRPNATAQTIRKVILESATVDESYSNYTQGRLNVKKALERLKELLP